MFTGLVAELGSVERLAEGEDTCRLSVRARKVLDGLKIGDSVAVNGVCLTVTDLRSNGFTADVMPETVRRTTMHTLRPGDRVRVVEETSRGFFVKHKGVSGWYYGGLL